MAIHIFQQPKQIWSKLPAAGEYEYNLLLQDSSIRKALYYLNGGYGYEMITRDIVNWKRECIKRGIDLVWN